MKKISAILIVIAIVTAVVIMKKGGKNSAHVGSEKSEIASGSLSGAVQGNNEDLKKDGAAQNGVEASKTADAEKDGCKTVYYKVERSKVSSSHNTWTMNNQFAVQDQGFNAKSICVRLKNTPIPFHYDAKEKRITVSSVSKNEDTISVTYCFAGHSCKENCVIPKDEFMMALDGSDGTTLADNEGGSAEEQELGKEDAALNQELKAFDLDSLDPKKSDRAIFADWNVSSVMKQCSGSAKVSVR